MIDVSAIDADVSTAVDDAFTFIGSAAFDAIDATGQLRFDSQKHIFDADSSAEFSVMLTGVNQLIESDFIL